MELYIEDFNRVRDEWVATHTSKKGKRIGGGESLIDTAVRLGYDAEDFKRLLMCREQFNRYKSRSNKRNRRRARRQAVFRERDGVSKDMWRNAPDNNTPENAV